MSPQHTVKATCLPVGAEGREVQPATATGTKDGQEMRAVRIWTVAGKEVEKLRGFQGVGRLGDRMRGYADPGCHYTHPSPSYAQEG